MVNLDFARSVFPLSEVNGGFGVWVFKYSSHDLTSSGTRFDGDADEVSAEYVVASIAAIAVNICPGLSELYA